MSVDIVIVDLLVIRTFPGVSAIITNGFIFFIPRLMFILKSLYVPFFYYYGICFFTDSGDQFICATYCCLFHVDGICANIADEAYYK